MGHDVPQRALDWRDCPPDARRTPGFDIDILDPDAAVAIESLVREHCGEHGVILVPIGLAPKRLIPLRTDEPFKIARDGLPLESFNRKLRDECLNGEIFYSLKEAQTVVENWRTHYNSWRPHSALGYRPPAPLTILAQLDEPLAMTAFHIAWYKRSVRPRAATQVGASRSPSPP